MKNTRNYDLRPDGDCIRVELKNGAGVDYISINRDLSDILDKWHITLFYHDGRLMADYWRGPWNTRRRLYLYDLALGCYSGAVHADTFNDDFQRYLGWKRTHMLTVDHLDGNVHNNTALNLSLMSPIANKRKQSFPAGFVPPYTLTTAFVDGEYRVQLSLEDTMLDGLQQLLDHVLPGAFRLNDEAGMSAFHFICEDADSFILCLRYLYDARFSWCNLGETARSHKRGHKDIPHIAADIKKSLAAQRTLAQMDRAQFQIFSPGECLNH